MSLAAAVSTTTAPASKVHAELAVLERELLRRTIAERLLRSLPPKVLPLRQPARYKGLHGGRGSAKSETFARLLLLRCKEHPGTRWICGREVQNSLEQSVKRLLEDLIHQYSLDDFEILNTQIRTPGGGIITFHGLQNHTIDSIKSLHGYHGAWIEEAQSISKVSLEKLRPTLRESDSEIWFSWNPETARDPIEFLRDNPPAGSIVIEMNWQDNPHFPGVLRAEMEEDYARDPENAAHVWGGKYRTRSEASVFKNWSVREFETPDDTLFLFGGDFGFSVDPTVLTRCWVDPNNERRLHIDGEAYQVGCEIDDTPDLFDKIDLSRLGMAREWVITADSARPETISYLQRHGYPRIKPAKKGAGSVEEGVKFLQNFLEIVIHPRCAHTVEEFSDYRYKVDKKSLQVTPVLEDKKNHVIDAVRYATEDLRDGEEWVTW